MSPDLRGRTAAEDRIDGILRRFASSGLKRSGGVGDNAVGDWIETDLQNFGLRTERQAVDVACVEDRVARLNCGGLSIPLMSHPGAPARHVSAPLIDGQAMPDITDCRGRIVVIALPAARWSSAADRRIAAPVEQALAAGAAAVVLVTHGPTGRLIALNCGATDPDFAGPVFCVAPKDAEGLFAAAHGGEAHIVVERDEGRATAFNVLGRLDRGRGRSLVLSTPRSGWFDCVGERGSGLAAWLLLVEWAATAMTDLDLAVVCSTGHERGHAGAAAYLRDRAPPPDGTALWLHVGANAATRDWREVDTGLSPLPSADPQRFLAVDHDHLSAARDSFAGAPGLEVPFPTSEGTAGELSDVLAAGYAPVAGLFGAHRFHHTDGDDLACVSAPLVVDVVERLKRFLSAVAR